MFAHVCQQPSTHWARVHFEQWFCDDLSRPLCLSVTIDSVERHNLHSNYAVNPHRCRHLDSDVLELDPLGSCGYAVIAACRSTQTSTFLEFTICYNINGETWMVMDCLEEFEYWWYVFTHAIALWIDNVKRMYRHDFELLTSDNNIKLAKCQTSYGKTIEFLVELVVPTFCLLRISQIQNVELIKLDDTVGPPLISSDGPRALCYMKELEYCLLIACLQLASIVSGE